MIPSDFFLKVEHFSVAVEFLANILEIYGIQFEGI
jgi:hypothetical protein